MTTLHLLLPYYSSPSLFCAYFHPLLPLTLANMDHSLWVISIDMKYWSRHHLQGKGETHQKMIDKRHTQQPQQYMV